MAETSLPASEAIGEDKGVGDESPVTKALIAVVTLAVTLGAADPEAHAREVGKMVADAFGFTIENKGLQLLVFPTTAFGI